MDQSGDWSSRSCSATAVSAAGLSVHGMTNHMNPGKQAGKSHGYSGTHHEHSEPVAGENFLFQNNDQFFGDNPVVHSKETIPVQHSQFHIRFRFRFQISITRWNPHAEGLGYRSPSSTYQQSPHTGVGVESTHPLEHCCPVSISMQ